MLDRILNAIGKFAYRCRFIVLALAVLLFGGAAVLQSYAKISYYYSDHSEILEVFPVEDTLVLVYDNFDENKVENVIETLSANEHVTSVQSFATTLGKQMNAAELSSIAGIDQSFINLLFYIHENGVETAGMSILTFVDFLTSDAVLNNELFAGQMDKESVAQLLRLKTIVNAIAANEVYNAETLAATLGVDASKVVGIYALSLKREMTIEEFIDAALRFSSSVSIIMTEEQLAELQMMDKIVDLVKEDRLLSPAELASVFPMESESFDENALKILYLMYYANESDMSAATFSLYDFFYFIVEQVIPSEVFSGYLDENMQEQIIGAKQMMDDGKSQLMGGRYSRIIITLDYELESQEMYDFYKTLEQELNDKFDGVYYFIGNSAMSNELSKTFQMEHLIISIVTAVVIFIVVCLTFRNVTISLILVAVIECAVFITMSTMVIANSAMYFIALLIVQCILMGSMVDYGILFTNYYIEVRKEFSPQDALPEVLKRSLRAIAMSATILILITLCCGLIMNGAVSSILITLCVGSTSALFLVVFVLPSLLVIFDKNIVKPRKRKVKTNG